MVTPDRLRATAIHEAGHAVIGWRFGRRISSITIEAEDDALGSVAWSDVEYSWDEAPTTWLQVTLLVSIAGPIAQERVFQGDVWADGGGSADEGYQHSGDSEQILNLLLKVGESAEDLESGASFIKYELEVHDLLDEFWPDVERVAEALLAERTLTSQRVFELLEPGCRRTEVRDPTER